MKCKYCGVEMILDTVEDKENSQVFHYKCPNKQCSNYSYKQKDEQPIKQA